MYAVQYWDDTHAKTDQHYHAEDCFAIDVEWFATGVRW